MSETPTPEALNRDETLADQRWRRLVDADAIGEATPEDAAFVRAYRGEGALARAEHALLAELRARGSDDVEAISRDDAAVRDAAIGEALVRDAAMRDAVMHEASMRDAAIGAASKRDAVMRDAAIVDAAVDRFLAGADARVAAAPPTSTSTSAPTAEVVAPPIQRWRPRLLIGGGLATAFAAAASWLLLVHPPAGPDHDPEAFRAEAPIERASATPRTIGEAQLLRGAAMEGDRSPLVAGATLEPGVAIHLADGACVGVPMLLEGCARGEATVTRRGSALVVDRGALAFESKAPAATIFWAAVAGAVILSDGPGSYAIVVDDDHWELRAERGALRVRLDGGDERRLGEGEALRGPPFAIGEATTSEATTDEATTDEATTSEATTSVATAREATTSAETTSASGATSGDAGARSRPSGAPRALLAEAQALRGAGDFRGAARVYRRLIREDGRSSLARTAQVALGQLYLGPLGEPASALRAFDAYLRGAADGPMIEEALYGKIEALRRLGRESAASEASAEFLRRFPRSSYAAKLRARDDG